MGFLPGKIPPTVLERTVLRYSGKRNSRVLVGPGIGRDAAIVRNGTNRVLVLSTDPITAATRHIGRHVVHINANDVAVAGAIPQWFLCTLLLPPGTRESELGRIMREIDLEARKLGVALVRGHTEATPGLTHPIIAGFMVGESRIGRFHTSDNARIGDIVVMTKTAGLEGTAILAADHAGLLRKRNIGASVISRAEHFADKISIVPEAQIATRVSGVTAMHDPTEGGVVNGLWELAEASQVGMEIEGDRVPVALETRRLCDALGLDPLRLLGSGSLLITCRPTKVQRLINSLGQHGIQTSEIGRLTGSRRKRVIRMNGGARRLVPVYRDELYMVQDIPA